MFWIDTHTHFSDEAFDADRDEAIARAREAGVCIFLHPDVDSKERPAVFDLAERYRGIIRPMAGLYPGSVNGNWQQEIDKMLPYLDKDIVAIGEIGLDYHWDTTWKAQQQEALRVQLEIAARRNLPVNIHLRDATQDFIDILRDCAHLGLRGNLHAFSGSIETFRQIQRYGDWYAGIGGVVTFRGAGIAQTVRELPLERIVLETDAPYLTPVPHRGERNESSYIPLIGAFIATLKGTDPGTVAATTTATARQLFAL